MSPDKAATLPCLTIAATAHVMNLMRNITDGENYGGNYIFPDTR